jgi:hypothetical protein
VLVRGEFFLASELSIWIENFVLFQHVVVACSSYPSFFSLLYNCQLLCFWQLALSIAVKVFPQPFFPMLLLQGCLLQTRYA